MSVIGHHAYAINVENQLYIPITSRYESNPTLTSIDTNKEPIYKRIVTPKFVTKMVSDQATLKVDLKYHVERSSNEQISDNRDDPSADVAWIYKTEKNTFSVNGYYAERATRETEFDDSQSVSADGTRIDTNTSFTWESEFTDKLYSSLSGGVSKRSYEDIDLRDHELETSDLKIFYQANETVDYFFEYGITKNTPEKPLVDSELSYLGFGLKWNFFDNAYVTINANKTKATSPANEEKDKQIGIVFDIESENSKYSVAFKRQIVPSGLGGFNGYNLFVLELDNELSDTSKFGASVNYRIRIDDDDDNETIYSNLFYEKSFGPEWGIELSASRKQRENVNVEVAKNNIISISLFYNYNQ